MFQIAHVSDLHISKVLFSIGQFFSKRWLGNLNLIISRKKQFQLTQLWDLADVLAKNKVEYLFITGDITTTSHPDEFELAAKLFEAIKAKGIVPIFLPGNHDVYTKGSEKSKRFYQYCKNPKPHGKFSLKNDRVETHKLPGNWWYVACDTSIATSLVSSRGYFSKTTENNLRQAIEEIPSSDNIIIGTHFPYSQEESKRKILVRGDEFEKILRKHDNIKLFLHGHTHHHQIDPAVGNLPVILDSGSSAHNAVGSWNLLSMTPHKCDVQVFNWQPSRQQLEGRWIKGINEHFSWSSHE